MKSLKIILLYTSISICASQKKELMKITKTVIPAAGLGTRLLPYTKTIPKELIALGNKPAIQYIIEEGLHSAIKDFFIIISKEKTQIQKYFSKDPHLEELLREHNKRQLLESVDHIINNAHLEYIEQSKPQGLGHAILMAENKIDNEYFSIMLPDDIIFSDPAGLQQLIVVAQKYNASVIAVREVPEEKVSSYGIVSIKATVEDGVFEIDKLVEKPSTGKAPSRLAITGRYVLSPKIFESLKILQQKQTSGELQLTDAIAHMMHHSHERVLACTIKGTLHDVGNPKGWAAAITDMVSKNMI